MDVSTAQSTGDVRDRADYEKRLERHVIVIRSWVFGTIAIGAAAYVLWSASFILELGWRAGDLAIGGLLIGFASSAGGAVLGFLFGTPRTLQEGVALPKGDSRLSINTALEEISSWLTKIIVGLGLVSAVEISGHFWSFIEKISYMVSVVPSQPAVLAAWIVYALVAGFIGMYLFTRSYLSVVLSLACRVT